MKRALVISDLHCGHRAGLTPPDYQQDFDDKYQAQQATMWNWYSKMVADLQPIDVLIVNGDAIDGKGDKSGATELISADRKVQCDMATRCIEEVKATKIYMTYGTAYHTGTDEDWESIVAEQVEAKEIHSHLWLNIEGVVFDCKHKVSGSIIPHGRHTGPARDKLWNLLWAEKDLQPKADVLIRSHVHYFTQSADSFSEIFTTPALQGPGSKFGARIMSGIIDIGALSFDCENSNYTVTRLLMDQDFMAEEAIAV